MRPVEVARLRQPSKVWMMDGSDMQPLVEQGLGPAPALVHQLVVVRPGGLADVVRSVPALRHLRRTYEHARISVAADEPALELLDACPYVDRVIDLAMPAELLLERFDLALWLTMPDGELPPAARVGSVMASTRVAYRNPGDPAELEVHPVLPIRLDEAARMLRLAWLLGGAQTDASLALWPRLADRNGAARLVGPGRAPLALVHAGARVSERRWPADRFARVCDALGSLGFHVVLVGGATDAVASDSVSSLSGVIVHDLTGMTSVGVLAGLLERADLFVGTDSGPAVLAGALGVQSVVIGPASLLERIGRPGSVSYVTSGPCSTCGEMACSHEAAPARRVALEPVLAQLHLSAGRARRSWQREQLA